MWLHVTNLCVSLKSTCAAWWQGLPVCKALDAALFATQPLIFNFLLSSLFWSAVHVNQIVFRQSIRL